MTHEPVLPNDVIRPGTMPPAPESRFGDVDPDDPRQGSIVLRSRWQRVIFLIGMGALIFLCLLAILILLG